MEDITEKIKINDSSIKYLKMFNYQDIKLIIIIFQL